MIKLRGMGRGARRGLSPQLFAAALVATTLVAASPVARAYTIASFVSDGCHEKITTDALRAVRAAADRAPPSADACKENRT